MNNTFTEYLLVCFEFICVIFKNFNRHFVLFCFILFCYYFFFFLHHTVFDDNGDGEIDANELQGVLGEDFGAIVEMIKEVDVDGNGKVSFEEFSKAMMEDIGKGKQLGAEQPGAGPALEQDRPDIDIDH